MKKIIFWIFMMVLAVASGFIIGEIMYDTGNSSNIAQENTINEKNDANNYVNNVLKLDVPTIQQEEKIGVNAEITEEIYYKSCGHIITEIINKNEKFVNLTRKTLEDKFPNWQVKEFSADKVVLYKEENDFCNEHFLINDTDGYVTIYILNNDDEIIEVMDKTEIATQYLTEVDKSNLQRGMRVYTKEMLNKQIEDFE